MAKTEAQEEREAFASLAQTTVTIQAQIIKDQQAVIESLQHQLFLWTASATPDSIAHVRNLARMMVQLKEEGE